MSKEKSSTEVLLEELIETMKAIAQEEAEKQASENKEVTKEAKKNKTVFDAISVAVETALIFNDPESIQLFAKFLEAHKKQVGELALYSDSKEKVEKYKTLYQILDKITNRIESGDRLRDIAHEDLEEFKKQPLYFY